MKEKYKALKQRVYEIMAPAASKEDKTSLAVDIILCLLVTLSGAAVLVELFVPVPQGVYQGLVWFEYITVAVFILEYLLRLWTCEFEYPECKNKFAALWEYITSFESFIDILSIVSITFNGIPKEFAVLRLIKLVKLVRLAKMSGYVKTNDALHEKIQKLQYRVDAIIDKDETGDLASKIFDIASVFLIVLSVSFILIETFPVPPVVHQVIFVIEAVIAVLFAIEYVLRVWTAPCNFPELRPGKARMKYIFSFMSLVDLLSIVPVFVANLPTSTGILKIFKLCKILRLIKASRYLSSIANFGLAIQKKKKQIIMSVIAMVVMIMICSVLMYAFENKEQPEVFVHGFSGIYYSYQTMVAGGSDISPVTPAGRALSTAMLLLGGCMIGVPIAIIASGFEDMIEEQASTGEEEPDEAEIYEVLKQYDTMSEANRDRFLKMVAAAPPPKEAQKEAATTASE